MAKQEAQASNMKCCLNGCRGKSQILETDDAMVNVRAFEKGKPKKKMAVNWQDGGAATFHQDCWLQLCTATKGSSSILLSDLERSMVLDALKTAEYHDSEATLTKEAERIANILKRSSYCISFTGAGISTAAGIGDFRGIGGKWTERDKVKNYGAKSVGQQKRNVMIGDLRPTYTHEALLKLQEMGLLKFLISQNTDGLHRLSGIPGDKISELHGNSFVEKCEICGFRYERPTACRRGTGAYEKKCPRCNINHRTGRKCSQAGCDGYLMNTIINFGDYLESDVLNQARDEARQADAVLVLGSTLMVSPANDLVMMGQQPVRLMICNRQITPYDQLCYETGSDGKSVGSRVFGDCDKLMRKVMAHLLMPDELRAWEDGRQARMAEYGLKRTAVK